MTELNRLSVEEFKQQEKSNVVVVLDNVRSMHNVGSVFRTSDAFLIEEIIPFKSVFISAFLVSPVRTTTKFSFGNINTFCPL